VVATVAIILMLIGSIWGLRSARAAGWLHRKPDWVLRLELGMDSRRPPALTELHQRIHSLAGWGRGMGGYGPSDEQAHTMAEPSVRRLLSVAGNPTDFDDGCRDFLLGTFYYLRPGARHEAAASLVPLLDADDVAVAVRAAEVLTRADEWSDEGDIDKELRRAALLLIERQGNRARSWHNELGALVETARRAGAVDDAAWSRFARQKLNPQLYARRRIRAGDELPYGIGWTRPREGADEYSVSVRWEYCRICSIDLGGDVAEFVPSGYATESERPVVDPYLPYVTRELTGPAHPVGGDQLPRIRAHP
jgi:hypothetical protein